jgi:hypothetical protein
MTYDPSFPTPPPSAADRIIASLQSSSSSHTNSALNLQLSKTCWLPTVVAGRWRDRRKLTASASCALSFSSRALAGRGSKMGARWSRGRSTWTTRQAFLWGRSSLSPHSPMCISTTIG